MCSKSMLNSLLFVCCNCIYILVNVAIALELYLFAHLVPDQTSIVSDSKLGYPLLGLYIVGIARVLLVALLEERNISGLCTRKM